MNIEIKKSYLVFPTSHHASMKSLVFKSGDRCVYDLDIRLDNKTATRYAYVDVRRFVGQTLEVAVNPEMKLEIKQKDNIPACKFREVLRPRYHFTPPEGWMNDPNGLVLANGVYHLFYQLNPVDTGWGNMHWGHATSTNLTDWEHKSIALFPDETGTMFSGGGVVDERNLLGLKGDGARPVTVLYYTAAGNKSKTSAGKPFTQCMAVSRDGCETFEKSDFNPILPHIVATNRDPKVVYGERLGIYVMSLYLEGDKYALFTSVNLTDWEKIQEISLPDDDECPAFFPMTVEGEEKWILMGAHDKYIVGDFDGNTFTPNHEGSKTFNYNDKSTYAAQRFEGIPNGRCVRFSWFKTDFERYGMPFNSAMTVPQELTLVRGEDGDFLRVLPAKETERLRGHRTRERGKGTEFALELSDIASDVTISVKPNGAKEVRLSLFGCSFGMSLEDGSFTDGTCTAPMKAVDGKYTVRILTDTCGFEVYISDGAAYMAKNVVPDANLSTLRILSDSEVEVKIDAYKMRKARFSDKRK